MIQSKPTTSRVTAVGISQAGLPSLAFLAFTESGTTFLVGRFRNFRGFFSFSDIGRFYPKRLGFLPDGENSGSR